MGCLSQSKQYTRQGGGVKGVKNFRGLFFPLRIVQSNGGKKTDGDYENNIVQLKRGKGG